MWKKYEKQYCRPAKGSPTESKAYIKGPYNKDGKSKPENPDAVEVGTMPSQGKRNDLASFHQAIKDGKRGRQLSADHLPVIAKYPKLEQRLILEEDEETAWKNYEDGMKPEVHVIWGKAGKGKSRKVVETFGRNVYIQGFGDGSAKSIWWDGYRGQDVILLDDFEGGVMSYKYLLRLLDRYPFRMQIKTGHCIKLAKKIYITANDPPEHWYPGEDFAPLARRIDTITRMD